MQEPSRITARVNLAGYWQPLYVLFKLFIYSFERLSSLLSIITGKKPDNKYHVIVSFGEKVHRNHCVFLSFFWYL